MTTLEEKVQKIQDQLDTLTNAFNKLKVAISENVEDSFEESLKRKNRQIEMVKEGKSWDEIKKNSIVDKCDLVEYVLYNADLDVVKEMYADTKYGGGEDMFCQVQCDNEFMPPFPVFKYVIENHMPGAEMYNWLGESIIFNRAEHFKFIHSKLDNTIVKGLEYCCFEVDPTQEQFDVVTALLEGEEKEEWLKSKYNPSLKK